MCAQQVKYNKNHLTRGVIGQATCWIYKFCVNMQYFMCQICFDSTQYFWFIIITFCWFAGFLFCCHFVACGQIISWPFSSFFFFLFFVAFCLSPFAQMFSQHMCVILFQRFAQHFISLARCLAYFFLCFSSSCCFFFILIHSQPAYPLCSSCFVFWNFLKKFRVKKLLQN